MAVKQYLDEEGVRRLVKNINLQLANKVNIGDQESALENYATNEALENLAEDVNSKITSVYHFRGSVDTRDDLANIQNPEEGDVYNITDTGMNVGWTGEEWDDFGTIADLTDYLQFQDVEAIPQDVLTAILYGGAEAVVDDVQGFVTMLSNNEPEVKIVLNDDVTFSDTITIAPDKKVVLDLGNSTMNIARGKEVTVYGELVINGGESGQIDAGSWGLSAVGENAKIVLNSGHLEAGEAPVTVQQGAQFVMNGGELEGRDNCPLMGQGSAGNGNVDIEINGGKLIAHITSAGYTACGIYMPNSGKLVMNGGEIISDGAGIVMRAGEVELNGGSIAANGPADFTGAVGDSSIAVGSYAVVYDEKANYPGLNDGEFKLTIGENMNLTGTAGDIQTLLLEGHEANIVDNRA